MVFFLLPGFALPTDFKKTGVNSYFTAGELMGRGFGSSAIAAVFGNTFFCPLPCLGCAPFLTGATCHAYKNQS